MHVVEQSIEVYRFGGDASFTLGYINVNLEMGLSKQLLAPCSHARSSYHLLI